MIRRAFEALGSGVAVYVIVVACSDASTFQAFIPKESAPDGGSVSSGGRTPKMAPSGSQETATPTGARTPPGFADAGHIFTDTDGTSGPSITPMIMGPDATPSSNRDAGFFSGMLDAMMTPTPEAMAEQTSGSRIKIRWWTTPDGLKGFAGYWDSELGIECMPYYTGEAYRCIPSISGLLAYTDAACTSALVFTNSRAIADPAKYTYLLELEEGDWRMRMFQLGEAAGSSALFTKSGSDCDELSSATKDIYIRNYGQPRQAVEVPISTFVELTRSID